MTVGRRGEMGGDGLSEEAVTCYDCGAEEPRDASHMVVHEMGSYWLCAGCWKAAQ